MSLASGEPWVIGGTKSKKEFWFNLVEGVVNTRLLLFRLLCSFHIKTGYLNFQCDENYYQKFYKRILKVPPT
jgi:hypothetical protein